MADTGKEFEGAGTDKVGEAQSSLQSTTGQDASDGHYFNATKYIEEETLKASKDDPGISPFAAITTKANLDKLAADDQLRVLRLVFKNHRGKVFSVCKHKDAKLDIPMRAAYLGELASQDTFELLVCSTLLGYHQDDKNFLNNKEIKFAVEVEHAARVRINLAFIDLKARISKLDPKILDSDRAVYPWIRESVKALGKEDMIGWLQAQISSFTFSPKYSHADSDEYDGFPFQWIDLSESTVSSAQAKIDKLVGFTEFKAGSRQMGKSVLFDRAQKIACNPKQQSYVRNVVIAGPEGSGKTTAAKCLAESMAAQEAFPEKECAVCDATTIIADTPWQSKNNLQEMFLEAEGRAIIIENIDEVLGGSDEEESWFKNEGAKTIEKCIRDSMENGTGTTVIITGSKKATDLFLKPTTSLGKLFPFRFELSSFRDIELHAILEQMAKERGFSFEKNVLSGAMEQIQAARAHKNDKFGNAIKVQELLEVMIKTHAESVPEALLQQVVKSGTAGKKAKLAISRLKASDIPVYSQNGGVFVPPQPHRNDSARGTPRKTYIL